MHVAPLQSTDHKEANATDFAILQFLYDLIWFFQSFSLNKHLNKDN